HPCYPERVYLARAHSQRGCGDLVHPRNRALVRTAPARLIRPVRDGRRWPTNDKRHRGFRESLQVERRSTTLGGLTRFGLRPVIQNVTWLQAGTRIPSLVARCAGGMGCGQATRQFVDLERPQPTPRPE